jgi:hypothetical protein
LVKIKFKRPDEVQPDVGIPFNFVVPTANLDLSRSATEAGAFSMSHRER